MGMWSVLPTGSALSLLANPALPMSGKGFTGCLFADIIRRHETRSFPAYGYGADYVTDNTYYAGESFYPDGAAALGYAADNWQGALVLWHPIDARYNYEEQVRGLDAPYTDELLGTNKFTSSNGLYAVSAVANVNLMKSVTLGGSVDYLTGSISRSSTVAYYAIDSTITGSLDIDKLSGVAFSAGVWAEPSLCFAIGASYRAYGSLSGNYTAQGGNLAGESYGLTGSGDCTVPLYGVGSVICVLRPRGRLFPRIAIGMDYVYDSDRSAALLDKDGNTLVERGSKDALSLSTVVEHRLVKTPFRMAFRWSKPHREDGSDAFALGVGTSIPVGDRLTANLMLDYSYSDSRDDDMFPDGTLYGRWGGTNRSAPDDTHRSALGIRVGVGF